jgi:hypothetical protein
LPLQRVFDAADPKREVKQDIWDHFNQSYEIIRASTFLIGYSDSWFRVEGIISPRQIIAWEILISIIGEDIFNQIPLALNHNSEDENICFLNEYIKYFSDPKGLLITVACGYFWKFVEECKSQRRKKMIVFYMDKVRNGSKIKIYTMDEDLKKAFPSDKPSVKTLPFRIDIHFTMIQHRKKKFNDSTLLFLELPHTEKTEDRLEAYFTVGQLRKLGCTEKRIKALFRFLKNQFFWPPHFLFKSIPSYFNTAFNWKRL